MKKIGIVGTSGYSGGELLRILANHPHVRVEYVASSSLVGERLDRHFPSLQGFYDLVFEPVDMKQMAARCDLIFTATPHGVAMSLAGEALAAGAILIDIGADFRFRDATTFSHWYESEHTEPELTKKAVYGLPELFRDTIQQANLIANPGCYPTSAILALAPLIRDGLIDLDSIHVCSMSGVSGGGKSPKPMFHFPQAVENVQAYGTVGHRHTPEIEQGIAHLHGEPVPPITFSPHLIPMSRGILTHVTAKAINSSVGDLVVDSFKNFYREEPFVRVPEGRLPDTKTVSGSNFCDVVPMYDERTGRIIVVSAIDNLVKGASGQAIQNMNIRFGLPEQTGLLAPGMIP